MCGISGIINCGDRETLARMNSVQAHRGPDDSGLWDQRFPDGTYIGLGSTRLAIRDLSVKGHMPMCNEDRTVWITYNGEIYNADELRAELAGRGFRFFSDTDTEVILRLYEAKGDECVKRLNGMFAFAICDIRSGRPRMFFARDHFGVKPFYYFQQGRRMAFASEIKALLQVPGINAEMDRNALDQYLAFLWVPEPKTMFRGIHKLAAGHCASFSDGEFKTWQYWDLTFPPADYEYSVSEADLTDTVRELLQRSVKRQMVGDVPVGAFLSAGLDSSSIVALMAQSGTADPLRTYTITYPAKYRVGESALDDPAVAARCAKHFGCNHTEIMVEPDVADLLPRLTWHMDGPTADPALIAAFVVCWEASAGATVMLSGVGGDELFAGYRKHAAHYWAEAYHRVPSPLRAAIEGLATRLPAGRDSRLKGFMRLAKKMGRSASLPPQHRFVMNGTYLDEAQRQSLYAQSFAGCDSSADHLAAFDRVGAADFLNQMLYLDSKIFMPSLNLNYNDKMSMASSVEVRVPFLDKELAEFAAWKVPPRLKLTDRWRPTTKCILRQAMRDLLPEEVLRQPKAGFAAPVDYWLSNDLREMADDLLSESRIKRRALFKPAAVRKFVEEHRKGAQDWSMQIWQFLTLELWMQTFMDAPAHEVAQPPRAQVALA